MTTWGVSYMDGTPGTVENSMPSGRKFWQQSRDVGKRIYIVFRMDDFSALSDTGLEMRILDLFEKKQIGITFGVVPFVCAGEQRDPVTQDLIPLPPKKSEMLRTKIDVGCLDVALHGYSHQTHDPDELSEFVGFDYAAQLKKLVEGKQRLEEVIGYPVEIFIPPWNSYDLDTLRALELAGFKILSAGWKGVAANESNIRFLPATCHLDAIEDAVEDARLSSDKQPVIVVLFHHYDFKEFNDPRGNLTLEAFSDLLDRLKEQKDLRLVSIAQANKAIVDLGAKRFLALERWREMERLLPKAFREKKPVLLYHEVIVLHKAVITLLSLFFLIFIFLSLVTFIISKTGLPS